MMLRDGSKGLNPDVPEGMPEVWKRLSERVMSVRDRICGRIERTLANALRDEEMKAADGHSNTSDAEAGNGVGRAKNAKRRNSVMKNSRKTGRWKRGWNSDGE